MPLLMTLVLLVACQPTLPIDTPVPDVSIRDQSRYPVQRGDVVEAIVFSGRVLPLVQDYLVFRTRGLIRTLYVRPGETVQAGQILADLEGLADLQHQKERTALNIQRAQTEVEIAQLNIDLYKQQTPVFTLGYAEQLAIKERELALAQFTVTETQLLATQLGRAIEESVLISPLTGQLRSLDIGVGDEVEAYDQVGIVAELSPLGIGAELSKDILGQLSEGLRVKVSPFSAPDQAWLGAIRKLPAPFGSSTAVSGRSPADTLSWISLDADLGQTGLVLDQGVQIEVILRRSENVLWLPPDAIRTYEGQTFVIVQENGLQRRVDVQTGLRSLDQVEILHGLAEGQVVLGQ